MYSLQIELFFNVSLGISRESTYGDLLNGFRRMELSIALMMISVLVGVGEGSCLGSSSASGRVMLGSEVEREGIACSST